MHYVTRTSFCCFEWERFYVAQNNVLTTFTTAKSQEATVNYSKTNTKSPTFKTCHFVGTIVRFKQSYSQGLQRRAGPLIKVSAAGGYQTTCRSVQNIWGQLANKLAVCHKLASNFSKDLFPCKWALHFSPSFSGSPPPNTIASEFWWVLGWAYTL